MDPIWAFFSAVEKLLFSVAFYYLMYLAYLCMSKYLGG